MATTLTYGSTPLDLSDDFDWLDEFTWRPIVQTKQYTLTGALVVETANRLSGRPITLASGMAYGWVPYSTVQTLRAWAALAAQTFTLVWRGVTYTVAFDDERGSALDAAPIWNVRDPLTTDYYMVTLRLIEV